MQQSSWAQDYSDATECHRAGSEVSFAAKGCGAKNEDCRMHSADSLGRHRKIPQNCHGQNATGWSVIRRIDKREFAEAREDRHWGKVPQLWQSPFWQLDCLYKYSRSCYLSGRVILSLIEPLLV